MARDFPKSTASIAGHPIHPMLVPFPIAFLVGALLTDIAYTQWGGMWAYASSWLIGAGIVSALLAAIFGFIDFFGEKRIRSLTVAWLHMAGNLTAVLLSVWNLLIHNRDGAIAVIPTGITLSAVVVILLLFNGWMGGHMVYRHGVAVRPLADADREER
ncbi:MAG: DUF2231 domain-containing protein [Sphingomicrobium sp.]